MWKKKKKKRGVGGYQWAQERGQVWEVLLRKGLVSHLRMVVQHRGAEGEGSDLQIRNHNPEEVKEGDN